MRDLDAPSSRQIVIKVELFLQFQRLEAGVGLSTPTARTSIGTCKKVKEKNQ